jgi:hypothetical protein
MFGQSAVDEPEPVPEPVPGVVAVVLGVVAVVVVADDEPVAAWVIAAAPPAIVPARANVTMAFRRRVCIFGDLLFGFALSNSVNIAPL